MHFDLIDLKLFQHTLECGNITAGASRSHLSLPAASARIRAMEASLGIPLLERNRRGVQPTPAGQALLQHARLITQQVERLQFDLGQYAQGQQGQVRLLCNTAALTEYLPELLASYLAENPGVSVDVQELPSLRIVQAITQGMADLGIVSTAAPIEHLQTRPFRDDPLVLVTPQGHPWPVRWRQVSSTAWPMAMSAWGPAVHWGCTWKSKRCTRGSACRFGYEQRGLMG